MKKIAKSDLTNRIRKKTKFSIAGDDALKFNFDVEMRTIKNQVKGSKKEFLLVLVEE